MNVVGIARIKNEADIIEPVVRHMLDEVDEVLVWDNGSDDGTIEILQRVAVDNPRFTFSIDTRVGYYQSLYMTEMAALAAEMFGAASWVVPFDADEWWVAREAGWGTVGEVLAGLPARETLAPATLLNHYATGVDPSAEPNPIARMEWRDPKPGALPKYAARAVVPVEIEMGNHAANYGHATPSPVLVVRHYPYRSPNQMIRKVRQGAAAYRAAPDLDADLGAHWRNYDRFSDDEIAGIWRTWFYRPDPRVPTPVDSDLLPPMVYDPAISHAEV